MAVLEAGSCRPSLRFSRGGRVARGYWRVALASWVRKYILFSYGYEPGAESGTYIAY